MKIINISIRVNDKPLPLSRRAYLAYVFMRIAVRQLIGSRYQLNILDCAPMDDGQRVKTTTAAAGAWRDEGAVEESMDPAGTPDDVDWCIPTVDEMATIARAFLAAKKAAGA